MITSSANAHIKEVRKLREKKYRQESGLFFAEGVRIVTEAVNRKAKIVELIVAPDLIKNQKILQMVEQYGREGKNVVEVSSEVFSSLSRKDGPQGVGLIAVQNWVDLESITIDTGDIWIGLDSIADPGNLGTILRTGDAVGAKGVILLDNCVDPFDPTTLRASMGAIFTQMVIKSTSEKFIQWKNGNNFECIGTSDDATDCYQTFNYPEKLVLLMGSERTGLQKILKDACSGIVAIPMAGGCDSLNLAVATALVLYEIPRNWVGRNRQLKEIR
jgi:TrmH family RNA methyltransferase